ncbi:MAG TPA: 50S ribosomal protein L25 [Patescibacteria group bacterium]|nr:50S ribosomal protein L25 [Patescibacteria group bacterium]
MTQERHHLSVQRRILLGRKVKSLRAKNLVPGNIFGTKTASVPVQVDVKVFTSIYKAAGETALVNLEVEGEKTQRPVLIVSASRHPVTGAFLHADFHQVDLTQEVTAMIPVEVIGESEAVKAGGVLVTVYNEIEVEALPTNLPEKFVLDISKLLKVGDTVTLADVDFDREKVTLKIEADEVLATIQEQEAEVVVEVAPAEPAEVELTKQGATKEEVAPESTSTEKATE